MSADALGGEEGRWIGGVGDGGRERWRRDREEGGGGGWEREGGGEGRKEGGDSGYVRKKEE